jgi:colanic acid/amylovoran biosynthesis glycosyltransferase
MKIAICAHDYPDYVSGPNVWLLRFIHEFQNIGIKSVVLFTRGGSGDEFRYVKSVRESGSPCYVYSGPVYSEHKIKWILKILQKESPDIFIPNLDFQAFYAARWVREAGIPTVGLLRSDDKIYHAIIEEFLYTRSPFHPSAMVCVSKYLEDLAVSKNTNNIIIRRIPSGTPIPNNVARRTNGRLRLIYTGRLKEEQKRISDVTRVLCRTVSEIPGTEAIIYGSGDAISSVLRIIETDGRGLPIRYGGIIDSNDMEKVLTTGQVFVLLSDYEGLPTSVMEAMACGLVPVCLNIRSGIPELVEHNKSGLLVNDRGDEFIQAIHRLQNENGLWEHLSNGARQKVKTEYSIQLSIKKWKKLVFDLEQNNSICKQTISIPKRYSLPDPHPYLGGSYPKWPGYLRYYGSKLKIILKKIILK